MRHRHYRCFQFGLSPGCYEKPIYENGYNQEDGGLLRIEAPRVNKKPEFGDGDVVRALHFPRQPPHTHPGTRVWQFL